MNSRLAIIHVAKKQLGLDEETYRAVLSGAGVDSAREITTAAQFNAVMAAFANLGFKPRGTGVKYQNTAPGTNSAFISKRQEYYVRGLWALASRARDERSLRRMVKRIGKTDDVRFLSRRAAQALILALRDICWKAGFNPDSAFPGEGDHVVDRKADGPDLGPGASPGVLPPGDGGDRVCQAGQGLAGSAGGGGSL
jgi:phage gp16-like protein